jgi:putative RecB family exonuclease
MSTLYSHSRLSSFENCKKQFHFRYVLKIPAESEGIEAFVGKRVHEVLERLYRFVGREQIPSLDQVIARYHALWDEHYDGDRMRIVKEGYSTEFYREMGTRCLSHYYRRHYPFDRDETLGIEERVVFPLDEDGRYRVQGIIDRIVRARDGSVEIHDYKTGAWVPSQKKLDEDRQLALYQIGLSHRYGADQPMRLVWHYLQKGQTRTSARSAEQLDRLGKKTIALIDRVEAEEEYPTTVNNLCRWCEYRGLCPEFADEATSAAALEGAAERASAAAEEGAAAEESAVATEHVTPEEDAVVADGAAPEGDALARAGGDESGPGAASDDAPPPAIAADRAASGWRKVRPTEHSATEAAEEPAPPPGKSGQLDLL